MDKLVVLDYSTCTVHVYDLDREDPITDEYINDLGLHLSDCYWIAGNVDFEYHKEVLK